MKPSAIFINLTNPPNSTTQKSLKPCTHLTQTQHAKPISRAVSLTSWANTLAFSNKLKTSIMGFDALMAILTCLGIRNIAPVPGSVTRWDAEAKKEVAQPGSVFPELCNKPIGLLLETEDYTSNTGEHKTRMVLKAVFQAKTELTASEILDRKTTPEQLPRLVAGLRHRPAKAARGAAPAQTGNPAAKPSSGFDDMDDDIPF
jgi:hypothetical protein